MTLLSSPKEPFVNNWVKALVLDMMEYQAFGNKYISKNQGPGKTKQEK